MGFQFIHLNSYSRTRTKTKDGAKWSAQDILNEAARTKGHCDHVTEPSPPIILEGSKDFVNELQKELDDYANSMKDKKGRNFRKDGLCMIAGVFSCPPDNEKNWEKIKEDSINLIKNTWGKRVKAIIEHGDEAFKHVHFYIIPNHGEKFDDLHPGRKAANLIKDKNGLKGEQNKAYKEAMSQFQDDYYMNVGYQNGLTRLGPGRKRLTREEWKKVKNEALLNAEMNKKSENLIKKAAIISQAAKFEEKNLEKNTKGNKNLIKDNLKLVKEIYENEQKYTSLINDIEKKQKEHDSIIDQYNDLSNKVNKLKAIINTQDIKKHQDFIKELAVEYDDKIINKYKAYFGIDKIKKNKNSGPSMN